jgi:hypothetical protein
MRVGAFEAAEARGEEVGGQQQAVGGEVRDVVGGFEGESGRRMPHTEATRRTLKKC